MALRRLAFSGLFYLAVGIAIVLGGKLAPSGPCTPGGDFVAIFLGGWASVGLFLKNGWQLLVGDKSRKYSLALHGVLSISWIIIVFRVAA